MRAWPKRPGRSGMVLLVVALLLALIVHVPSLLAFPYVRDFGATTVWSVQPIPSVMAQRLARADALLATSPIDRPGMARQIYLTDGGWRWRLLALTSVGAFAIRRPLASALVFNRTDATADRVTNGAGVAGTRSLSGTIAHESVHMLTAARYGVPRSIAFPRWKVEGYADYVAQESSLSDADAARLRHTDPGAPALFYHDARRRVAAGLRANGGSVDRLFD